MNDTVPELDPNEHAEEATSNKEKVSKRNKEKEKETKKEKPIKTKNERQSRTKNQSNLQIDHVVNIRSRSKSSTRRAKSPAGKAELEWDGKNWKAKKEEDHSDKSCRSDLSERSFMDSKHQAELLDKLMG